MISTQLINDIAQHLREAKEFWVAVALMKDAAFTNLQNLILADAKQNYLIGINLPTSQTVLELLKNRASENFKALVYRQGATFHTKSLPDKKGK